MKISTTFSIEVKDLEAFQDRLDQLKLKKSAVITDLISIWMDATGSIEPDSEAEVDMRSLVAEYMQTNK